MRSQALLVALRRTAEKSGRLITFVSKGLAPQELTPAEAQKLVADRAEFIGYGSKHRVKRIEWKPAEKPMPIWKACWRNTGSACIWATEGERSYRAA